MQAQIWDQRFDFNIQCQGRTESIPSNIAADEKCGGGEKWKKDMKITEKNKREGKIMWGKKEDTEILKDDDWLSGFWYYYIRIQQWTEMKKENEKKNRRQK